MRQRSTLRGRVQDLPALDARDLWPAQAEAIRNLEMPLKHGRPRALIQMATGSGKTFTAANICYRLIKFSDARRILFLVDRANLGRQTLKEFQMFSTSDDGRKFTELYNVQHLRSNSFDAPSRVVISTIQRLYSILRGESELSEELGELSAYDIEPERPVEVAYDRDDLRWRLAQAGIVSRFHFRTCSRTRRIVAGASKSRYWSGSKVSPLSTA
jgi:type I restriction enzyme R subunit